MYSSIQVGDTVVSRMHSKDRTPRRFLRVTRLTEGGNIQVMNIKGKRMTLKRHQVVPVNL